MQQKRRWRRADLLRAQLVALSGGGKRQHALAVGHASFGKEHERSELLTTRQQSGATQRQGASLEELGVGVERIGVGVEIRQRRAQRLERRHHDDGVGFGLLPATSRKCETGAESAAIDFSLKMGASGGGLNAT